MSGLCHRTWPKFKDSMVTHTCLRARRGQTRVPKHCFKVMSAAVSLSLRFCTILALQVSALLAMKQPACSEIVHKNLWLSQACIVPNCCICGPTCLYAHVSPAGLIRSTCVVTISSFGVQSLAMRCRAVGGVVCGLCSLPPNLRTRVGCKC